MYGLVSVAGHMRVTIVGDKMVGAVTPIRVPTSCPGAGIVLGPDEVFTMTASTGVPSWVRVQVTFCLVPETCTLAVTK
jgi:hypothetical protein